MARTDPERRPFRPITQDSTQDAHGTLCTPRRRSARGRCRRRMRTTVSARRRGCGWRQRHPPTVSPARAHQEPDQPSSCEVHACLPYHTDSARTADASHCRRARSAVRRRIVRTPLLGRPLTVRYGEEGQCQSRRRWTDPGKDRESRVRCASPCTLSSIRWSLSASH